MVTIIVGVVCLLVGSAGTYLLIWYCKTARQAIVSGVAALAVAGGGGLAVYYNGEPVPVVDVHARMIPEANGMNYLPEVSADSGDLVIASFMLIPLDTTRKAVCYVDSQRVTFAKNYAPKLLEKKK
jgi:hypothetical protein